MDKLAFALLILLLVAPVVGVAVAIAGTVDAVQFPRDVWPRAGHRRRLWVAQALAAPAWPVVAVWSGIYVRRVRPRLIAAQADQVSERPIPRDTGPPPPDGTRIRIPVSTLVQVSFFIALGVFLAGLAFPRDHPRGGDVVFAVVLITVIDVMSWVSGVTLRRDFLVVNGIGRRRIPWSQVRAVQVASSLGARYVLVWVGQRRVRLRAPLMQFGLGRARFEHDLHAIERAWLAYRDG